MALSWNPKLASPPPLPLEIGPYRIAGLLGRGGTSSLYLGLHPETKQLLAIKVLLPSFLKEAEMVERFLNEAAMISLTCHPNIVKLYSHGTWQEGAYIAMEYIHGVQLGRWLTRQPLSLKQALDLLLQIAYAVCHLHTYGIIHRDLKPENILVTKEGQIKLIDFGIAHLLKEKSSVEQVSARLIGTPIYMSPEQRLNPEAVSYPADIYALGIIAYELTVGPLKRGKVHLSQAPLGLQKILAKALQVDPKERYQDIVALIFDISSYLKSKAFLNDERQGSNQAQVFADFKQLQQKLISTTPSPSPSLPFLMGFALNPTLPCANGFVEVTKTSDGFHLLALSAAIEPLENALYPLYFSGFYHALKESASLEKMGDCLLQEAEKMAKKSANGPLSLFSLSLPKNKDKSPLCQSYGPCQMWHWQAKERRLLSIEPMKMPAMESGDRFIILLDPSLEGKLPLFILEQSIDLSPQDMAENALHYIEALSPLKLHYPYLLLCLEAPVSLA